jgi:phosphatidylserine/phosphatidylglycerophosphate/cardiolipin synthase-like enzyme
VHSFYDNKKNETELVITIPSTCIPELAHKFKVRITLGVIIQLIARSSDFVIIGAPFIQKAISEGNRDFVQALKSALARGVHLHIISTDAGLEGFIHSLYDENHEQIHFFRPKSNVEDNRQLGSHAKFCVADGKHAYIGSANLTDPGLFGNLEMGVLVHGKVASQISEFWNYLVDTGFFVEIEPK